MVPAGIICEIMKDDGGMARVPDLIEDAASQDENAAVASRFATGCRTNAMCIAWARLIDRASVSSE
jgi:hypothetical protein